MIHPLVWGAFIASEAFASKKRDEFAKDEALRNQPKGIYYDKISGRRINQDEYNITKRGVYAKYGVLTPPEDSTSEKFKNYPQELAKVNAALNSRYPKIGTLYKDGKETYPPDEILKTLMYGKQKPKTIQIIAGGKSYMDMATFAAADRKRFEAKDYVTQEISFTRSGERQELKITDDRPDPKDPKDEKRGSKFIKWDDNTKSWSDSTKNEATHLGEKVILSSGKIIYNNVKDYKPAKKETPLKTVPVYEVTMFGTTHRGTLAELEDRFELAFKTDEDRMFFETSLKQVGEKDIKVDSSGAILDIKNKVTYTVKEAKEKTEKKKYYVIGFDGENNPFNIEVPQGMLIDEFIAKNGYDTYPSRVTKRIEYDPKDGSQKEVMSESSKSSSNKAILAAANGGYLVSLNSKDGKTPPIKFPAINPNVKSESDFQRLQRANTFYTNHKDLFKIESTNKFAMALFSSVQEAYTARVKSGKTEAELDTGSAAIGSAYGKDIKQFVNQFPALARMRVQLTDEGVEGQKGSTTSISFGDYVQRAFGLLNTEQLDKQILDAKNSDPDKYVIGLGNIKITANKNMANKLENVAEGEELGTNVVMKFDDKYKKAVDYLINTAKTTEEKTDITNFIMGQATLKGPMKDNTLDYTGNQKGLNGLVNAFEITYPISVGGKTKMENGLDLLLAFMHPNWNQSARFKAGGSKLQQVALAVAAQSDNDFTKAYNFMLKLAPDFADGNLALRARYKGSKKSVQDIKTAARGIVTTGRNAKEEQIALAKTYFDERGNIYPFGAAAGQFIITLRGGLYVGQQLFNRGKEFIRSTLGVDIADKQFGAGTILDEADADLFTKVKNAAYTRVGSFRSVVDSTDPDIIAKNYNKEAEAKARMENKQTLDKIIQNMNRTEAYKVDGVDRLEEYKAYARRSFHKFMLAYQLAAAIQGGTGGRTISDQDVQNILSAFNFNFLSDPRLELEAINRAGIMLDRLITYNQAIADGGPKEMFVAIATDRLLNEAGDSSMTRLNGLQVASFIKESGSPMSQGNMTGGGTTAPVANQMIIGNVKIPKVVNKKAISLDTAYRMFRQYERYTEQKSEDQIMSKEDFEKEFNVNMGKGA